MNPLTNVRNIKALNEQDIKNGIFDHRHTWHSQYKESAYIFVGGLPYDLTEGDILCVFSQYGEIVNINLVRDKKTGKSQGYCFLCYEDQRSTILAVDNLNSIKLGARTIRVDHVLNYRPPKSDEKDESGNYKIKDEESCAPKTPSPEPLEVESKTKKKKKKEKKEKKKKKKKKFKMEENSSDSSETDEERRKEYNEYLAREREKSQSKWDQGSNGRSVQQNKPNNASSTHGSRGNGRHDSDSDDDEHFRKSRREDHNQSRDNFDKDRERYSSPTRKFKAKEELKERDRSPRRESKIKEEFDLSPPRQSNSRDQYENSKPNQSGSDELPDLGKRTDSPPRKKKKSDSGKVKLGLGKMKFKKK